MASPPPLRLWVGMLVVMMVVKLHGAGQKCVFDEVQTQVRVVRAAQTPPESPPREPRLRPPSGQEPPLTPAQITSRLWRRSPTTPASPQPIRIHTWIPRECVGLSDAEESRVISAVKEAVRRVSSLLSVNRVRGPLLLRRDVNKYCKFVWSNPATANYNRCGRANNNYRNESCLDVTIPDNHLAGCDIYLDPNSPRRTVLRPEGGGLRDTDFLLYLHIQSTDKCRAEPNVLAYAVHCQTDSRGRPIAGAVVICRDRLTQATDNHQAIVQTVIHELFHALGFSKDLFNTWKDCSSSSQVGVGCSSHGKVIRSDGSGQMRIYTPSVISALQKHLASADPELGGPLENLDVPSGRVSSHWESRVLRGSIMAAALQDPATARIDPVTLAALQDTGWYQVNLSRAQSLVWGEGEGAMFGSLSTCQDNSSSFFCTGCGFGCHFLHHHKGECQTDPYLEGCRAFKPLKNASECWKEENTGKRKTPGWRAEILGLDSRCFFSNLTEQRQPLAFSSPVEGRCYRHRCTGPNRYQIQVSGSEWVDCPAGGAVQIEGYQGLVFCPDRRLCLYPDITPPSYDLITIPATYISEPDEMFTSGLGGTRSPIRPHTELTVATALCVTAAPCLLAALAVCYRKSRSCRDRVHVVPGDRVSV